MPSQDRTSPHLPERCYVGVLLLSLAAGLPASCVVVPPGYGAVLLTPSGGLHELGEGAHVIPPGSQVDSFDLRGQERDENLHALAADGAPVAARTSLVTYHVAPLELVVLERQVGPEYYRILVQPIVRSTVRRVLARYQPAQLNSASIAEAQQEITKLAAERLRPYHIVLDSIDLRLLAVVLSEHAYAQVTESGVLEQQLLAMPQKLEVARQQAEARREAARAIAAAHTVVAPTLTPEVLADSRRRAEQQLLTAPAASVVVSEPSQPYKLEVIP